MRPGQRRPDTFRTYVSKTAIGTHRWTVGKLTSPRLRRGDALGAQPALGFVKPIVLEIDKSAIPHPPKQKKNKKEYEYKQGNYHARVHTTASPSLPPSLPLSIAPLLLQQLRTAGTKCRRCVNIQKSYTIDPGHHNLSQSTEESK
jgi:hypothetical protein